MVINYNFRFDDSLPRSSDILGHRRVQPHQSPSVRLLGEIFADEFPAGNIIIIISIQQINDQGVFVNDIQCSDPVIESSVVSKEYTGDKGRFLPPVNGVGNRGGPQRRPPPIRNNFYQNQPFVANHNQGT